MPRLTAPIALLLTTACGPSEVEDTEAPSPSSETALLGIGDSYFAWNAEEGLGIPDVVGDALGVETYNLATSGATVLGGAGEGPLVIPNQYTEAAWDWVVMDGGGNDLEGDCGCGACEDVLDDLLSADGHGAIADLVAYLNCLDGSE